VPPVPRRRILTWAGLAAAVLALAVAVGGVLLLRQRTTLFETSSCAAKADGAAFPLQVSQAGIAATIAGVAERDALPGRAVVIAYAAALQESKLANLTYGDRDSVGVFQQRPSQGWGPARKLEDPVYATAKFFGALRKVPGYLKMPVYQAAQAVQRSADGYAYNKWAPMAGDLARAFTGRAPHAVWCWYGDPGGRPRLAAAASALTGVFGPLAVHRSRDPGITVPVPDTGDGWAVAAWLVSHADAYGISTVRYGGYQWRLTQGSRGWVRIGARRAPPGTVLAG
jgi:hypothetical protein